MREKDFQTEFGKKNNLTGCFELKLCKTKRLPFSALKEHQEKALVHANTGGGFYYKISDFPVFAGNKMRFNRPKPFDCLYLKNMSAYVVVMFYIPRKQKNVYYITIENYLRMREESEMKSFTEAEAEDYCSYSSGYFKRDRIDS